MSVVLSVAQASRSSLALALHTLGALPSVQERLRGDIDKLLQKYVSIILWLYLFLLNLMLYKRPIMEEKIFES